MGRRVDILHDKVFALLETSAREVVSRPAGRCVHGLVIKLSMFYTEYMLVCVLQLVALVYCTRKGGLT